MAGPVGGALVVARAVGVGLSASAAGAALAVSELGPKRAIAMGTCGAYRGSGLALEDVVIARRVRLMDATAARGLSEFPAPMSTVVDADIPLAEALNKVTGARLVDVATTLAITVDAGTAAHIALASAAQVEHLEAHGMATACGARSVPFGAVFGVANFVGPRAREEWREHQRAASEAAAEAALCWLRSGWAR